MITWPLFNLPSDMNVATIIFPFFLMGLLTLFTIFFVVQKFFGFWSAIWSTTFVMFHQNFLEAITDIENYHLFVSISIWIYYFLVKAFTTNKRGPWIALTTLNVLAVWAYPASIILVFAEFFWIIISKNRRDIAKGKIIYILIFLNFFAIISTTYLTTIFMGAGRHKISSAPNDNLILGFFNSFSISNNSLIIYILLTIGLIYFITNIRKEKYSFPIVLISVFLLTLVYVYISDHSKYKSYYNFTFMWIPIIISSSFFTMLHRRTYNLGDRGKIKKIASIIITILLISITILTAEQPERTNFPERLFFEALTNIKNKEKIVVLMDDRDDIVLERYIFYLSNNKENFTANINSFILDEAKINIRRYTNEKLEDLIRNGNIYRPYTIRGLSQVYFIENPEENFNKFITNMEEQEFYIAYEEEYFNLMKDIKENCSLVYRDKQEPEKRHIFYCNPNDDKEFNNN